MGSVESHLLVRGRTVKLACVLNACSNSFHGKDHGIFQARSELCGGVQSHQLGGSLGRPGRVRLGHNTLLRVLLPHLLQRESLLHIQSRDVWLTKPQSLLQCRIALENVRVPCNLQ